MSRRNSTRDMALRKYNVLLIQDTNTRIGGYLVTRPRSDHKLEETIWVRSENRSQCWCPVSTVSTLSTLSSPGKHELLTSCVTACSRHPDCSSHTWHPLCPRLCQPVCPHPLSYPAIWTLITNNFYFYSWSTISHHGIEEMILVCVCILLLHLLCRYCVNKEAELQTPDSRCSRWAVTSNKNRAVSISTFTIHFRDV